MAEAYPRERRDDVVAVARKGQSPLKQIAKDFGISEGCLDGWMKKADVEDGNRPGVTASEQGELREARKRIRLLEQENKVLRTQSVHWYGQAFLAAARLRGNQPRLRSAIGLPDFARYRDLYAETKRSLDAASISVVWVDAKGAITESGPASLV